MGCVACLSCVSSGEASCWHEPVSQLLGCWLLCATRCCCELPSLFPIPRCLQGLPWRLSGKESACQCRRPGFDPWVWRIPWRRKWQLSPVFLPGKSRNLGNKVSPDYSTVPIPSAFWVGQDKSGPHGQCLTRLGKPSSHITFTFLCWRNHRPPWVRGDVDEVQLFFLPTSVHQLADIFTLQGTGNFFWGADSVAPTKVFLSMVYSLKNHLFPHSTDTSLLLFFIIDHSIVLIIHINGNLKN